MASFSGGALAFFSRSSYVRTPTLPVGSMLDLEKVHTSVIRGRTVGRGGLYVSPLSRYTLKQEHTWAVTAAGHRASWARPGILPGVDEAVILGDVCDLDGNASGSAHVRCHSFGWLHRVVAAGRRTRNSSAAEWRNSCGQLKHNGSCCSPYYSNARLCCSADMLHYTDLENFPQTAADCEGCVSSTNEICQQLWTIRK